MSGDQKEKSPTSTLAGNLMNSSKFQKSKLKRKLTEAPRTLYEYFGIDNNKCFLCNTYLIEI